MVAGRAGYEPTVLTTPEELPPELIWSDDTAPGFRRRRAGKGYRSHREAAKFDRLFDFASALPRIRRQVAHDLARPGMPKEKVVAAVVRLLEETLVRVGNEEYARDNQSYGLTTLRNRHVKFTGTRLRLTFKGKTSWRPCRRPSRRPPRTRRSRRRSTTSARYLRNTRAVCRASYVHPAARRVCGKAARIARKATERTRV